MVTQQWLKTCLWWAYQSIRSKYLWWGLTTAASGYLAIAPVTQRWSHHKTAIGFGLSVPCLAASILLSRKLDEQLTIAQIDRHLHTQWQIDRMADDINLARAQFDATIDRLINGAPITEQMASMQNALSGGLYLELPESSTIPTEDLAATIASSGTDEQNFLFVGKSRSGKTSLLLNAIARKDNVTQGMTDWYIFNGKPERDNDWGGLRNSPNDYWDVNGTGKADAMSQQVRVCVSALQQWQNGKTQHYPMVLVFDELNNQRILLEAKQCKELDKMLALYCTQCMSEQSGLWISTHSHNIEDIGLNRKLQQSFQMVVVGRNGKYESIQAVLDDGMVIRDRDTRDRLKTQLQQAIASGEKGSIAFTNIGGVSRLVMLPFYGKDVSIRLSALNSPAALLDDEPDEPDVNDAVAALERLFKLSADEPEFQDSTTTPDLTPEAIAIIAYSQRKGTVSVRDCQRNLNKLKGYSAEQISELFLLIENAKKGTTDRSGDTLRITCLDPETADNDTTDR